MNPLLLTDAYKLFHRQMYPDGTTLVFSNWTPRTSKWYRNTDRQSVVVLGTYLVVEKLIKDFDEYFFTRSLAEVIYEYRQFLKRFTLTDYDVSHIEDLHDLGYLPLQIRSLPEGSECPIGVPYLTIHNTLPEFYWLTNYLETYLSANLWSIATSATIANDYRKLFDYFAKTTVGNNVYVDYQGHDFSMRGMYGHQAAILSGIGHLSSFVGTDTLGAVKVIEDVYGSTSQIGTSVPATENSVQCALYDDIAGNELDYLDYILEQFPTGIVSIVCDGFDFWDFITNTLPQRKEQILSRDGKLVVRPDSGDPVTIITGFFESEMKSKHWTEHKPENLYINKGAIETLYDIFGGKINELGYKELDSHIGLIYGDSITYDRAEQILDRLARKGFASNNVVLGIGSFTYQYNTRDTFGFAMKATYCEIDGVGKDIYKSPKTGDGTKKSARGLTKVVLKDGKYVLKDQVSWEEFNATDNELKIILDDDELSDPDTWDEIKNRIKNEN